jgi:colanic acid biosynthesis glycosyl transferase WcaI
MPDNSKILIVNQAPGPMHADIVNAVKSRQHLECFSGVEYNRVSALARLITWLVYSFQLLLFLLFFGNRFTSLLVVSNPPFAPLLAPLARRPYFLLLYDLYPHVLAQIHPRSLLESQLLAFVSSLWHKANRFSLARAERVFTLSQPMANQLRPYFSTHNQWRDRVLVIPPWSDTENMSPRPVDASHFREIHSIHGLLLTYSGNIGLTHPLEILIDSCRLLDALPNSPDVQVFLIGHGPKRTTLLRYAKQLSVSQERLRFLDPLPYSELPTSLSAADLAVVALDGAAASASLPSKVFNALACGTPILALTPADSALALLVNQHNCGYVIEPGPASSQDLVELLIHLTRFPQQLKHVSANALAASHHYTSFNASRLVDSCVDANPPPER